MMTVAVRPDLFKLVPGLFVRGFAVEVLRKRLNEDHLIAGAMFDDLFTFN